MPLHRARAHEDLKPGRLLCGRARDCGWWEKRGPGGGGRAIYYRSETPRLSLVRPNFQDPWGRSTERGLKQRKTRHINGIVYAADET